METDEHLKKAHTDRIENMRAQTAVGMAHWAGTGPEGKTCHNCGHAKFSGYYSIRGKNRGLLKPISCKKYNEMMGHSPTYQGTEAACRFFYEGEGPPKRV